MSVRLETTRKIGKAKERVLHVQQSQFTPTEEENAMEPKSLALHHPCQQIPQQRVLTEPQFVPWI